MPPLGLELSRLRATVDIEALAERQVRLHLEGGLLRLSQDALARMIPPDKPVAIHRVTEGRIVIGGRFQYRGLTLPGEAEIAPRAGADGRAHLSVVSIRAAGFIPIPASAAIWLLRNLARPRPGIRFGEGDQVEIDLAELARPAGIFLPPLQAVRAAEGVLELEF